MLIRLKPGFFDIHERTAKLNEMGDPLVGLNEQIDWEAFQPTLNIIHEKPRKSKAGVKPIDAVLMLKKIVFQQLPICHLWQPWPASIVSGNGFC